MRGDWWNPLFNGEFPERFFLDGRFFFNLFLWRAILFQWPPVLAFLECL